MRNLNKIYLLALTLGCIVLFGCATTSVPRDWELEEAPDLQTSIYGSWISIELKQNKELAGELIAISDDTIYVAEERLTTTALSDVSSARMVTYESSYSTVGAATFGGMLLTITNGFFLIFTAPLWLIGGTAATSSRSWDPIIDYPDRHWNRFKPFARFPHGLPEGIDRGKIRAKQKGKN